MDNRTVRATLDYHEATKHSLERLRQSRRSLEWGNQPVPFKIYRELEPLPLPRDFPRLEETALRAIGGACAPAQTGGALGLSTLARLLYLSAGITKVKRHPGGEAYFRAYPNTGALYHVDLYVVCGELPELAAGVYHFGPQDFALRRLREGDFRGVLSEATGGETRVVGAPLTLVSASTYWRNAWKYEARAWRHCFWDAGTLHANLLAAGSAEGLEPEVVVGFVDGLVEDLLGLDPEREGALTLVPLGRGSGPPQPTPDVTKLRLETLPLSHHEVDYPAIREAQAASSLRTPEEVRAWRGGLERSAKPPPEGEVRAVEIPPEDALPTDSLQDVVERRGSTRHFDPTRSLTFEELSVVLERATAPLPSDFLGDDDSTLLDLYVIAHAVEGLEPGAYVYRSGERSLERLRRGEFRAEAGRLGLFQELPADAAANVYSLVDLERVLDRYGNRGYRAAQLEGGIRGGRMYLAAYTQRFGATGLTFLDDEVTEFFSPHAAGKSVMFLTALGRSVRRTLT
jgi:SagB-type dehydrogenase family enzyme